MYSLWIWRTTLYDDDDDDDDERRNFPKMKQTTTATVLADNAANVPTTLVSYLQRLKSLDETSISVSDKVSLESGKFRFGFDCEQKTEIEEE